jgi:ribosomal protein S18 acetylase RimI-like enzyme
MFEQLEALEPGSRTDADRLALARPIGYSAGMDDVVIRRAERRDLQQLGALGAQLVRLHHGFDSKRFMAPEANVEQGYAWFLGTELENPDAVIFVAETPATPGRASEILGYVYAGIEARSWKELRDEAGFIHDLLVRSELQSQGLGTRLLETASEWLVTRGVPRIMLWTAAQNPAAQKLFERLGFRRTMIEMTRER